MESIEALPTLPSTFHSFSSLPAELRLQIWHLAIPSGVYIHFSRHPFQENVSQHLIARCSLNPIPPMLHTNSEARVVALEYFQLLGVGASWAYFNPAVDTLLLGPIFRANFQALTWYPRTILGSNAACVRHIALYSSLVYARTLQDGVLKQFSQLQSFSVLDLREWEDKLQMDLDALRAVLSPKCLRAENLERVGEGELRSAADGTPQLRMMVGRGNGVWRGLRDTELDVRVMRLPFTGVDDYRVRTEDRASTRQVLDGQYDGSAGVKSKGNGRLQKLWRYMRRPLSRTTT